MPQKTLKCYGIRIDTAEVVFHVANGAMQQFLDGLDVLGVYQDQKGLEQVIVFKEKLQAKQAVKKGKNLGFGSIALYPTMLYVPEAEIKQEDA